MDYDTLLIIIIITITIISNPNGTKWSTIQGVISKFDDHKEPDQFEIMCTIYHSPELHKA